MKQQLQYLQCAPVKRADHDLVAACRQGQLCGCGVIRPQAEQDQRPAKRVSRSRCQCSICRQGEGCCNCRDHREGQVWRITAYAHMVIQVTASGIDQRLLMQQLRPDLEACTVLCVA